MWQSAEMMRIFDPPEMQWMVVDAARARGCQAVGTASAVYSTKVDSSGR
jgi:hypothetical protein